MYLGRAVLKENSIVLHGRILVFKQHMEAIASKVH